MSRSEILIMAAGTGGHIFPALAVARELQARQINVHWLGTPAGMENDVLAGTDITLHRLSVGGLRGKGKLALVKAPFMLIRSLLQAIATLRRIKPACVLGMGGYVAGPGGVAARLCGYPLVIHEQNAIAGTTNRLLAPIATRALQAFPATFKASIGAETTGNPVRAEIAALAHTIDQKPAHTSLRILVLGGSLGAAALNRLMVQAMQQGLREQGVELWHQTGKRNIEETRQAYQADGISPSDTLRVVPFIDDMAQALQWADLVVCRAGAGTLAEITLAGLPAILVPFPYAIDDHQTANAEHLVSAGAAVLIQERELTADWLVESIGRFTKNPQLLREMSKAAQGCAVPAAARRVADVCMEVSNA